MMEEQGTFSPEKHPITLQLFIHTEMKIKAAKVLRLFLRAWEFPPSSDLLQQNPVSDYIYDPGESVISSLFSLVLLK